MPTLNKSRVVETTHNFSLHCHLVFHLQRTGMCLGTKTYPTFPEYGKNHPVDYLAGNE